MKFTQTDISHLNSVLNICSLVGIDAILISEKGLRSVNADKSCAFLVDAKIPKIEGTATLGLSKLRVLKQRLDLFKTDPKLSIEVKQKASGEYSSLEIKGSNATVQFRVTNPNAIKAPVGIEDTPVKSIVITKEEAQLILNAEKAMGAKKVTIAIKKNNAVSIEFADSGNDTFVVDLANTATPLSGNEGAFTNYYFTDVFSPLLRAAIGEQNEVEVVIYEASAKLTVDGYELTLLSPMDAD